MKRASISAAVAGVLLAGSMAGAQVQINELDSDTAGVDALEFVELWDGGVGNTALDGLVVVFFNGSAATNGAYAAFDLDTFTTNAQGFFLLGNAAVVPAPQVVFAGNTLQNGVDAVAIYIGNAVDFPNGTSPTTTNLIDAVVYETADPDDLDLQAALGLNTEVDESGLGDSTSASVGRLCFGGLFEPLAPPTPGASNGTCDEDIDGDGILNDDDNCPTVANPGQEDCDADGEGDACELDCDNNGLADACEILDNPALDCNQNGQLDFCEPDCNQNGLADVFEICLDPGLDCNENFQLDQCEPDCNFTGLPDTCDIEFGISLDVNGNLIPDECEPDCNGNGVPDDWDLIITPRIDANGDGIIDVCQNATALVINELLADPPTGPTGDANGDGTSNAIEDEFIEIVNNDGQAVDIGGWTISDNFGIRHVFPGGTVVADQCSIVIFGGGSPIGQFGGGVVQTSSTFALGLNNDGDTITLRDDIGHFVTSVTYGIEAGNNTSLTRSPDITGLTLVLHDAASGGILYSAGKRLNLALFDGCTRLTDTDLDGIPDVEDNCPSIANSQQADCDNDGTGDTCDNDPDNNGNGIADVCEVAAPPGLRINELRIDQTGTDLDEYVELKGTPGTSLDGLSLLIIGDGNGLSGVIEFAISLHGLSIPADGHFLIAENSFSLAPSQVNLNAGTALNMENGDNVTYVLVTNSTGTNGQDLDVDDNGVLDVTPWLITVDAVGVIDDVITQPLPPNNEHAYGVSLGFVDVVIEPVEFNPGHLYRCETSGTWTAGEFNPFIAGATDTAGVLNLPCPAAPCPSDVNGDDIVNVLDLLAVISAWGTANPAADINDDGVVNIIDLLAVISAWGACPD
ncbi:MAG: lamin tail domain-containing protein [Phycisphaerales bacterium]|nr:lamin tail domain-containing protein [Phycisphaerales bacterium]MCI0630920.1 lamin tail domain-containing protein [Phycisphaerales bacterium]